MIARRLGATGALGTVAEHQGGYYTGRLVGDMLHGEAKAVAVRAMAAQGGYDLERSFAYGDSMNDGPMLSTVGHPCAINPDWRLRRHARAKGWPIKDFRGKGGQGRRSLLRASAAGFVWALSAVVRGIGHILARPFRRKH